jgi:hypothetical protein
MCEHASVCETAYGMCEHASVCIVNKPMNVFYEDSITLRNYHVTESRTWSVRRYPPHNQETGSPDSRRAWC